MPDDIAKIQRAWTEEASQNRLGLRPSADKAIQAALVPAGGNWQCVARDGAVTRMIVWGATEVALVNPRGDLVDATEGHIAMGMRATPALDKALRAISVLARDADNLDLIAKIARAAVDYIEQPAPRIVEPDDDDEDDTTDDED